MRLRIFFPVIVVIFIANLVAAAGEDFAFRDGDKVVFLGDSITAGGGYTKMVEQYTLLRYPSRKVRFSNAGRGGDTAVGGLERLEQDVFNRGATVVTVAYGVNDIGWGMKADEEHKQKYLNGIRGIVEECKRRKVRVFICSPAITGEDPDKAQVGFLQKMTDEGLALAKSLGAETIDIQRGMRAIQREVIAANKKESDPKKHIYLHTEDTIHLNELGQLAMGYAMLKGLGAPDEVSSVMLDAEAGTVLSSKSCKASQVKRSETGLEFVRLDEGLPLNLGALGGLHFRFIPIPDGLNHYMLGVRNLPKGAYEIVTEGRLIGTTTAEKLAAGVNISSMTTNGWVPGGSWDAQAAMIKELTMAREKIELATRLRTEFLSTHPENAKLAKQTEVTEDAIIKLQRETARPFPYHFQIRKQEPKELR
jgi:lysophospholipase L1-like esterase